MVEHNAPEVGGEVWCLRSGKVEIWDAEQGWLLLQPVLESIPDTQGRGISFRCLVAAPHEHKWRDVKP